MIRVGIIGAARVATYAMIAPAKARSDVVVQAVAARSAARAADYAATHGIPHVAHDYAALCARDDVDVVYVATPPAFHLAHARLALAAGKPVLVEKPFTMDAAEARTLLAEAAMAGLPVFEAQHSRCHGIWADVAALLPRLGHISHVEAAFDAKVSTADDEFRWNGSLGGGALMDLGVYPLTWVRAVAGAPLAAHDVRFRRERGADAAFSATLHLAGGVTATVSADMAAPFAARLRVTGDAGTLDVANPLAPQRGGHGVWLETAAGREDHTRTHPGSYDAQLAALVAALQGDAPWPLAADDPLHSMQAIDLIRAAGE
ncbi:MAG: Gfo/Idh/MocA family oxidoreductase [Sphingomonadales bacterium]